MKLEVIKAIQAIGDKMTAEEIQIAFEHQFVESENLDYEVNKKTYSDQELEELLLALQIYKEPKEVMKDKSFVERFCQKNKRTKEALYTKLYSLRKDIDGKEKKHPLRTGA